MVLSIEKAGFTWMWILDNSPLSFSTLIPLSLYSTVQTHSKLANLNDIFLVSEFGMTSLPKSGTDRVSNADMNLGQAKCPGTLYSNFQNHVKAGEPSFSNLHILHVERIDMN